MCRYSPAPPRGDAVVYRQQHSTIFIEWMQCKVAVELTRTEMESGWGRKDISYLNVSGEEVYWTENVEYLSCVIMMRRHDANINSIHHILCAA
jgi:hypothetical protein